MGRFLELAKSSLTENKNIVISKDNEGNISIAQQLVVEDNGRIQNIFLKNAISMDVKGLKEFKNAIDEALAKIN